MATAAFGSLQAKILVCSAPCLYKAAPNMAANFPRAKKAGNVFSGKLMFVIAAEVTSQHLGFFCKSESVKCLLPRVSL